MSSPSMKSAPVASPGPKVYSAPGVASLPYHQRPLPPGWVSQYDPTNQAYFYIDERSNPPTITWEDPRPAYYMAMERGSYAAPPPPGMQGSQDRAPQPQYQQMQSPQSQQMQSPQPQQMQTPQPQQMQTPQPQPMQQTVIQNADGTVTTLTSSSNQPIVIQSGSSPQQQQQQQQPQQQGRSGPGIGTAIVGTALVTSMLRPRPRVLIAPRRRRF